MRDGGEMKSKRDQLQDAIRALAAEAVGEVVERAKDEDGTLRKGYARLLTTLMQARDGK